jgi:hypothetical protein
MNLNGATAGANQRVCLGAQATLGAAPRDTVSYAWQPADYLSATDVAQPTFSGAPAGDYVYTLTARLPSGETVTTSVTVSVLALPALSIIRDRGDTCALGVVDFAATSDGANVAWDFDGDGTIDASGSDPAPYTFAGDGPYTTTVSATSVDNCVSEATSPIDICPIIPTLTWTTAMQSTGENAGTVTLTLSTDLVRRNALTVTLAYGGTASAADFVSLPTTLTLPAGAQSVTLTLTLVDDALDEDDETLSVSLASVTGATLGATSLATITITDDDAEPIVGVSNAGFVSESAATAAFPVTLSAVSAKTVSVSYAAIGGSAALGQDFTATTGTVTFLPGETVKTVAVLGTAAGFATIIDDDSTQTTLGIDDIIVSEGGGVATFTVWRAGANGNGATVDFATNDLTALSSFDYVAASGTLTFLSGEVAKPVSITLLNDSDIEALETFALMLTNESGATLGVAQGTATLVDDDGPTALSTTNVSSAEDTGFASVTLIRSGANTAETRVDVATAAGTADASDFGAVNTTLTFASGVFLQPVVVPLTADTTNEPDETFDLNLSNATGASLTTPQATITILNDDGLPGLSVNDVFVSEGAGFATVSVLLTEASAKVVTVAYATAAGSALTSDYDTTSGVLTFNPGDLTQTFLVPLIADAVIEPNEFFFVQLSGATNAILWTTQARVTLIDDDAATSDLTIVSSSFASENQGSANFTVLRSGDNSGTASADFSALSGTALAGTDFTLSAGTVSFAAGEAVQTIAATMLDDAIIESDESFSVVLANATGATLSISSAVVTILDDDGPTALVARDGSAVESAGFVQAVVTRSGNNAGFSDVDYATTPGTATAPDFTALAGSLHFGVAQTVNSAWIALRDDNLSEDDETFALTLSNANNAALANATSTLTIVDDDPLPTVAFTTAAQSASEASGTITLTVHASAVAGRDITVSFAVAAASTAQANDYTLVPGVVTIPAGSQDATFVLSLTSDPNDEDDETVIVDLTGATNAVVASPSSQSVTVIDDDPPPFVSVASPGFISETAASATFTVSLTVSSGKTVSVPYQRSMAVQQQRRITKTRVAP